MYRDVISSVSIVTLALTGDIVLTEREAERIHDLSKRVSETVAVPAPTTLPALVTLLWRVHVRGRLLVEHTTALLQRLDRRQ